MTPEKLKKIMKKHDHTDTSLAAATGYNQSTINRYVNGVVTIPKKFEIMINNLLHDAQNVLCCLY